VRVLEISRKAHENNLRWTIFATNFLHTMAAKTGCHQG